MAIILQQAKVYQHIPVVEKLGEHVSVLQSFMTLCLWNYAFLLHHDTDALSERHNNMPLSAKHLNYSH